MSSTDLAAQIAATVRKARAEASTPSPTSTKAEAARQARRVAAEKLRKALSSESVDDLLTAFDELTIASTEANTDGE